MCIRDRQNRLAKAQRQLGALVYSLHKAEEENQPLVDKYIENIAEGKDAFEKELRRNLKVTMIFCVKPSLNPYRCV